MPLGNTASLALNRRRFIGGLTASSLLAATPQIWAADPQSAGKDLIYHSENPANAEPALNHLIENWLTPYKYFYIRSHGNTPQIDPKKYSLSVEGLVRESLTLSLDQLSDMADAEATATMTCAGNRRSEHSAVRKVDGVQWQEGAIGNARWGGVKLSTLLKKAGLKEGALHVWFDGLDDIDHKGEMIHFGGSIPLAKAMLDTDDMPGALVATKMNGQPLAPDHGYPARTVVPGYIGARSVKWLGRIVVSDRPSPNHYVKDVYKIVTRGDLLEVSEESPIYRFPLNAAICSPQAGAKLKPGKVTVAGYALPEGVPGTTIARVEVSTDGGRLWKTAKLDGPQQAYCWQLWQAEVPVTAGTRQLTVRAIDSRGIVQPRTVPWNLKGYMFNAWHNISVTAS